MPARICHRCLEACGGSLYWRFAPCRAICHRNLKLLPPVEENIVPLLITVDPQRFDAVHLAPLFYLRYIQNLAPELSGEEVGAWDTLSPDVQQRYFQTFEDLLDDLMEEEIIR